MHLIRVTPTWDWALPYKPEGQFLGTHSEEFRATRSPFHGETHWVVRADFPRFGGGEKRQSDFEVILSWADTEKIIQQFYEAGQPEAVQLRRASELASAVKELGWQPPEPVAPQSK